MYKEVAANRQLLWQLTKRNIQITHKGSCLGFAWNILNPLLTFSVYATVFGMIFNGRYGVIANETGADYALGIFLSLTLFQFLAEVITTSPNIIVSHPNYVKKVVFPLAILPLSTIGATLYRMLTSLSLFFCGLLIFGNGLSLNALWFPVIILPLIILSIGLAWLLSALGVFLRDITQIIGPLTLIIMYSSAIFFSTKMILEKGPAFWSFLKFNPLIHIVEQSRRVMIWNMPIDYIYLLYAFAVSLMILFLGYFVFKKLRPAFADVL